MESGQAAHAAMAVPLCPLPMQFIAVWKPLAEWVRANEAGTLGYEAMIADTDPLKVMVFER